MEMQINLTIHFGHITAEGRHFHRLSIRRRIILFLNCVKQSNYNAVSSAESCNSAKANLFLFTQALDRCNHLLALFQAYSIRITKFLILH